MPAPDRRLLAQVRAAATALAIPRAKLCDLAPRVMAMYNGLNGTQRITFVQFCRMIDPSVPYDAQSYRNHPTYYGFTYMRRIEARRTRGKVTPRGK